MFGQPTIIKKGKKGKRAVAYQEKQKQEQKTFTPGQADVAPLPPKVVTDTPADQLAKKVFILFIILRYSHL